MNPLLRLVFLLPLFLGEAGSYAQAPPADDGFQRRNGTMYLIRRGQARPMPHDVHLPNGRTVTRDGFVVEGNGQRRELAEGRGCTLLGVATTVATKPDGMLALAVPAPARPVAAVAARYQPDMLTEVLTRRGKGHRGWGYFKKHGKRKHGKGN
jgi:hypothetical protein